MKKRNLKYILMSIFCIAIASTLSVAFLLPSSPKPEQQKEYAWQCYDDLWMDWFDLDNPEDPGEYHFDDYHQIEMLANQIGSKIGGEVEALPSALQEMANGVDNWIQIDEEQVIEGGCGSISIGGFKWFAASIFTATYQEDDYYESGYDSNETYISPNNRIIVSLVAPNPELFDSETNYPYSRYHLAESDSPKSVRYNNYGADYGDGYAGAYVSAYTLGHGGVYFASQSQVGEDAERTCIAGAAPYYGAWYTLNFEPEPQVRDFDLSLFNNGGMNRFIYNYYGPSLMTPKQYIDWQIQDWQFEELQNIGPCLLQTYSETLESDIQNYASDYYKEYMQRLEQKPEVANRTILLGVDGQVVPAMYTSEEIEMYDPDSPWYNDSGLPEYAYDIEYLVIPCMQLDISETYIVASREGYENYPRYGTQTSTDREVTLDYNDGTGRTITETLRDGKWPSHLGAPYSRYGYKFNGWYSEKYGGFMVYDENGEFVIAGGNTLYAHWLAANWEDWAADSYAGGLGTKNSPYQIATAEQLAKLSIDRDTEGKYYIQTGDINLSAHPWHGIRSFGGNYDGQNFGIYYMKCLSNFETGLFTVATNATIKNVNIKSGTIMTEDGRACGLVATGNNVIIENCTNWVDCSSTSGTQSGGIVADLTGTSIIRSCINFGDVYSASQFNTITGVAGGIVGYCSGDVTIEDCINMGDISATMDAGGIIGKIYGAGITVNIISCSSLGNLKSTGVTRLPGSYDIQAYYPGAGLVGFANLSANDSKEDSTLNITACSIIGEISIAEGNISPFCGRCAAEREEIEDGEYHWYNHKLNQVLTASYAYVNGKGYYTTALSDANWAKYWTIAPAINSNATLNRCLPVKKAFLKYFWIGDLVDTTKATTQAEFAAAFSGFTLLT